MEKPPHHPVKSNFYQKVQNTPNFPEFIFLPNKHPLKATTTLPPQFYLSRAEPKTKAKRKE